MGHIGSRGADPLCHFQGIVVLIPKIEKLLGIELARFPSPTNSNTIAPQGSGHRGLSAAHFPRNLFLSA